MLAFHAGRGDAVLVIHATDGAKGDPQARFSDIAERRRTEGAAALAALGVTTVERWQLPDGELAANPQLRGRVAELFRRVAPRTLYAFSPIEYHPDHRAVAQAVIANAELLPADCRVLLFGVNHPGLPGVLFDTTDLVERKRQALACFASQLAYNDFAKKAIDRDHAATVNIEMREVQHAEAFVELTPARLPEFGRRLDDLLDFLHSTP
jgi:LmbE family N-acetylglucosaminyl deacetylase